MLEEADTDMEDMLKDAEDMDFWFRVIFGLVHVGVILALYLIISKDRRTIADMNKQLEKIVNELEQMKRIQELMEDHN